MCQAVGSDSNIHCSSIDCIYGHSQWRQSLRPNSTTQCLWSIQYIPTHIHMQTCNVNFAREHTCTLCTVCICTCTCIYVYLVPASEAGHGVSGGDVFFNVVFQGKVVSPYYCCLQFLVFQVLPFTHTCAVVFKIRHNHYYTHNICKNWSYTSYNYPN